MTAWCMVLVDQRGEVRDREGTLRSRLLVFVAGGEAVAAALALASWSETFGVVEARACVIVSDVSERASES